jgi:hypothetical protein
VPGAAADSPHDLLADEHGQTAGKNHEAALVADVNAISGPPRLTGLRISPRGAAGGSGSESLADGDGIQQFLSSDH